MGRLRSPSPSRQRPPPNASALSAYLSRAHRLARRARRHPYLLLAIFVVFLPLLLVALFVLACNGGFGRWYFNYAIGLHPGLIAVMPRGSWGGSHPDKPPRWIQEIYDAPHMANFALPKLTKPTYASVPGSAVKRLTSPAIVKLDVFSTVQEKSYHKRKLIRAHSPLLNLPKEYRHLVEVKFVMGHSYTADWTVNTTMEALLKEEQDAYGDLIRLNLEHGENLREGKILDWIRAVGDGEDAPGETGGRPAWWLFKIDDDALLHTPRFLDELLSLDASQPVYVGTSLNRWPPYHHHFTGMVTGFSWPLVQTLTAGINKMSRKEIQTWWDDDVLTGEIMFCLPPGPKCANWSTSTAAKYPAFCDPRAPPPHGWASNPPRVDPRTGLIRHDVLRLMGDKDVWFVNKYFATHSWWFKFENEWRVEWNRWLKGVMWSVPKALREFAETKV